MTNVGSSSFSVIDTSSNTVVATAAVGSPPEGVAITPDGTRAYVTNPFSDSFSVIDTSSNTVVATSAVGFQPVGVAITPDGTRAYVANSGSASVSVIDTSNNAVVATVTVGSSPVGVAITPAAPSLAFSAFSAKLDISAATGTDPAGFDLKAAFTPGAGGTIDPLAQPLTLQVGTCRVTVPAGSFHAHPKRTFTYEGTISGVSLEVRIMATGAGVYRIHVEASGMDLTGLTNPVTVSLGIGKNAGTMPVTAHFQRQRAPGERDGIKAAGIE